VPPPPPRRRQRYVYKDRDHRPGRACGDTATTNDALVAEAVPVAEKALVGALEADAQDHVQHAEDHRDLHLERVGEKDFVGRDLPHGVEAERVHAYDVVIGVVDCGGGGCCGGGRVEVGQAGGEKDVQ
jgi:hypothetical protein